MPVMEMANAMSPYCFTDKSLTIAIDKIIPEIFIRKVDSSTASPSLFRNPARNFCKAIAYRVIVELGYGYHIRL